MDTPTPGEKWWNPIEGGDVLVIESYDGAYAVAYSYMFGKQILVSASHFGTTYVYVEKAV